MKVLHVVTLHTPTGEFGGPTRVAVNLCRELLLRGHEARILALGDGFEQMPSFIDGIPVELFRARQLVPGVGVAGLGSRALLRRARHLVQWADVVHVHLLRDLVTLPVARLALRADRALLLQTHGMVDPSDRLPAKIIDVLAMRRVLTSADTVAFLTDTERRGLLDVAAGGRAPDARESRLAERLVRLVNGVQQQPLPTAEGPGSDDVTVIVHQPFDEEGHVPRVGAPFSDIGGREAPPLAGWRRGAVPDPESDARQRRENPLVVFVARLQARKRPTDFVAAIPGVLERVPGARFVLAGPDAGELAACRALADQLGVTERLLVPGALDHEAVLALYRRAAVSVLPSVSEPFPVAVLESLSVGVPVVLTDSNGLAVDVAAAGAGRVVDSREGAGAAPQAIADAIVDLLDPDRGAEAAQAARSLVARTFSIEAVVDDLERHYDHALARHRSPED